MTDGDLAVRTYAYQILQYSPNYGTQVTPVTPVGLATTTLVTGLHLDEDYVYFIKVCPHAPNWTHPPSAVNV